MRDIWILTQLPGDTLPGSWYWPVKYELGSQAFLKLSSSCHFFKIDNHWNDSQVITVLHQLNGICCMVVRFSSLGAPISTRWSWLMKNTEFKKLTIACPFKYVLITPAPLWQWQLSTKIKVIYAKSVQGRKGKGGGRGSISVPMFVFSLKWKSKKNHPPSR